MRAFVPIGLSLAIVGVLAGVYVLVADSASAFKHETRVRYPGEEAAAREACGERKVMYWWVGNPRRSRATMHIECAGKVSVEREVKF